MGWICDFCGTENSNSDKCCRVCDAPAPIDTTISSETSVNENGILTENPITDGIGTNLIQTKKEDISNEETSDESKNDLGGKIKKKNGKSMLRFIGFVISVIIGFTIFLPLYYGHSSQSTIMFRDSIGVVDTIEEAVMEIADERELSLPLNSIVILKKYMPHSEDYNIYYISSPDKQSFRNLYVYNSKSNTHTKLVDGMIYNLGFASPNDEFVYFVVDRMGNSNRNWTFCVYQISTTDLTVKTITSGAGFKRNRDGFQVSHAFLLNPEVEVMAQREYEFIDTYYDFNGNTIAMGKKYSYTELNRRYGMSLHELGETGSEPSYALDKDSKTMPTICCEGVLEYYNARFGYTVLYPALMKPSRESENGDGSYFICNDITLTVSGSYDFETEDNGFERGTKKIYRTTCKFFVSPGKL